MLTYEINVVCDEVCENVYACQVMEHPDAMKALEEAVKAGWTVRLHESKIQIRCPDCSQKADMLPPGIYRENWKPPLPPAPDFVC